jgi:nicotinamide mononucleotide (NMN) deamidase PncC
VAQLRRAGPWRADRRGAIAGIAGPEAADNASAAGTLVLRWRGRGKVRPALAANED